jgi:hypothetical protein
VGWLEIQVDPTSYPPLGVHELADAPIPSLLGAGVPVALASDDPLLFGVGLAGQYAIGREPIGLSDDELAGDRGPQGQCLGRSGAGQAAALGRSGRLATSTRSPVSWQRDITSGRDMALTSRLPEEGGPPCVSR